MKDVTERSAPTIPCLKSAVEIEAVVVIAIAIATMRATIAWSMSAKRQGRRTTHVMKAPTIAVTLPKALSQEWELLSCSDITGIKRVGRLLVPLVVSAQTLVLGSLGPLEQKRSRELEVATEAKAAEGTVLAPALAPARTRGRHANLAVAGIRRKAAAGQTLPLNSRLSVVLV